MKKEPNLGTCSKSLFSSTNYSKCFETGEEKTLKVVINQPIVASAKEINIEEVQMLNGEETIKAIEGVVETLRTIYISSIVLGTKKKWKNKETKNGLT